MSKTEREIERDGTLQHVQLAHYLHVDVYLKDTCVCACVSDRRLVIALISAKHASPQTASSRSEESICRTSKLKVKPATSTLTVRVPLPIPIPMPALSLHFVGKTFKNAFRMLFLSLSLSVSVCPYLSHKKPHKQEHKRQRERRTRTRNNQVAHKQEINHSSVRTDALPIPFHTHTQYTLYGWRYPNYLLRIRIRIRAQNSSPAADKEANRQRERGRGETSLGFRAKVNLHSRAAGLAKFQGRPR